MDIKDEYHDPDYAGTSENVKEEPPSLPEDERIEKIRTIIRREFSNELDVRENEVMMIDQRMTTSRRLLHRLRYALVSGYYREQRLQAGAAAGDAPPRGQRRLHPSVRKLLGKRTADLSEIFRTRQPRSRPRPDYSAMLQIRNYTVAADSTKSLRPALGAADQTDSDQTPDHTADPAPDRKPRKQPRHLEPRVDNVLTLDEQTRNKVKHRYRIVIGNTSKYAPPASRADRSTHKWLLYVRDYRAGAASGAGGEAGAGGAAGVGAVITRVTARLHHSYAPHHTVTLHKPPFHISRRGWGEFTARVELHFALPELNPPASVPHTIKLDRNYTGLQTLGAETIVDVWLYSSAEMVQHSYQEDAQSLPPTQTDTQTVTQTDTRTDTQTDTRTDTQTDTASDIKAEPCDDSWMEFFARDAAPLDVDEMIIRHVKAEPGPRLGDGELETQIKEEPMEFEESLLPAVPADIPNPPTSPKKRIMKYIDPTTGKIYYLEMDRTLDLSTVQEIVINNSKETTKSPVKNGVNAKKKKGISLLKPEVKNSIRTEQINASFRHIQNDHCYLGYGWSAKGMDSYSVVESAKPECGESRMVYLRTCLGRLGDVRSSVYFLLRQIPLVDSRASHPDFQKCFPFVVDSEDKYWKLDFAKRRNMEWSRAKLITRLLSERPRPSPSPSSSPSPPSPWSTKQVLVFARLHGLHPARSQPRLETQHNTSGDLDYRNESNIKELYRASDITTLGVFDSEQFNSDVTKVDLVDSDEEIDIVGSVSEGGRVRAGSEGAGGRGGGGALPVADEDRLRFLFVERVCADIGVELRNEDIGNGYSYSAVHCVLAAAARCLAEELLRSALAAARRGARAHVWGGWSSTREVINLEHVYQAAGGPPPGEGGGRAGGGGGGRAGGGGGGRGGGALGGRLRLLSACARGARRKDTSAL